MNHGHACSGLHEGNRQLRRQAGISIITVVVLYAGFLCGLQPARSQYVQQGPKLVGSNPIGAAQQGFSVALSTDGSTAIIGGPLDSSQNGASWVFTRSGNMWSQQSPKLVGGGATASSQQGAAVAVSGDGITALVGGPQDNSGVGAVWGFFRDSGVWVQPLSKFIGSGATGAANQGVSVALSVDGNTAIVGGPQDNSGVGAAWVFTREGNSWVQQGKLQGNDAVGAANQGASVALSADGNTAIVGALQDNSGFGAAWIFSRNGSTWSQQGPKLVGSGAAGSPKQGHPSVSPPTAAPPLSVDPNVRIAEAATEPAKHALVDSPVSAKLRIVGINFDDGTASGLLIAREESPEASGAK